MCIQAAEPETAPEAAADTEQPKPEPASKLNPSAIRLLTSENCKIYTGKHDVLHVNVTGERAYGGVFAVYAFPVAFSDKYISLLYTNQKSGDREAKEMEIGIIEDLSDFPEEQSRLIRQALARRHFVHTVTKISNIDWDHGLLQFEVDTDKGKVKFHMRYTGHNAVDYGKKGKVIIDVNDNRYVIPNIDKLSDGERKDFLRYIYW